MLEIIKLLSIGREPHQHRSLHLPMHASHMDNAAACSQLAVCAGASVICQKTEGLMGKLATESRLRWAVFAGCQYC